MLQLKEKGDIEMNFERGPDIELFNEFNLDPDQAKIIELNTFSEIIEPNQEEIDDFAKTASQDDKEILNSITPDNTIKRIIKDLNVYEIHDIESGSKSHKSKVELTFKADNDANTLEIIEFIPKSVAESASDITFSVQPTILNDDPVVKWTFNNIKKGDSKTISYTVDKKITSLNTRSIAGKISKQYTPKNVCGDLNCEGNETRENCCTDCRCADGYECKDNSCIEIDLDQCKTDSDCDDDDTCTTADCYGNPKQCHITRIGSCKNNDNCCPDGCYSSIEAYTYFNNITNGTAQFDISSRDNDCPIPDSCTYDLDCDDGRDCTTDYCGGDPKLCRHTIILECVGNETCCKFGDDCCNFICEDKVNFIDYEGFPEDTNENIEYLDIFDNTCHECLTDTECNDSDSCTKDICSGSTIWQCSNLDIVNCTDSDSCCPSNCNYTNDNDCETPHECKNKDDCPDDGNECTIEQCVEDSDGKRECIKSTITSLTAGDGCCPAGTSYPADEDCKECDSNSNCNDNNVSTTDTCHPTYKTCQNTLITSCTDDDSYCPPGCDLGSDNDCSSGCTVDNDGDLYGIGCILGSDCDDNNASIHIDCNCDGITHEQCSPTKPLYCNNGILTDNCDICSCDSGTCLINGSCGAESIILDILSTSITPPSGPINTTILIEATINSSEGVSSINAINKEVPTLYWTLNDDGNDGDLVASDDIYSIETTIDNNYTTGTYNFNISVTDTISNYEETTDTFEMT